MKNRLLLCCDWGTSNFRLYLIETTSTTLLGEVRSEKGIADIFKEWQHSEKIDRINFFRHFLQTQIYHLGNKCKVHLADVPVILSGMASSSIGMMEIPYATVPFSIHQPNLSSKYFPSNTTSPNDIYLFGGLKTNQDVMRGEEVQLLGMSHLIDMEDCVCLLPGTHSKHIWIKNKTVINFKTFMTGECFQLLNDHSILKNSIQSNDTFDQASQIFFQKGVQQAQNSNILNSLFGVRTNTLLQDISNQHNYYYLSGLLIGQELKELKGFQGQLLLNGSNHLAVFYQLALKTLQLDQYLTTITEQDIQQCIPKAHLKLYKWMAN